MEDYLQRVEWSGVEWSGVEWGRERFGTQCDYYYCMGLLTIPSNGRGTWVWHMGVALGRGTWCVNYK